MYCYRVISRIDCFTHTQTMVHSWVYKMPQFEQIGVIGIYISLYLYRQTYRKPIELAASGALDGWPRETSGGNLYQLGKPAGNTQRTQQV